MAPRKDLSEDGPGDALLSLQIELIVLIIGLISSLELPDRVSNITSLPEAVLQIVALLRSRRWPGDTPVA